MDSRVPTRSLLNCWMTKHSRRGVTAFSCEPVVEATMLQWRVPNPWSHRWPWTVKFSGSQGISKEEGDNRNRSILECSLCTYEILTNERIPVGKYWSDPRTMRYSVGKSACCQACILCSLPDTLVARGGGWVSQLFSHLYPCAMARVCLSPNKRLKCNKKKHKNLMSLFHDHSFIYSKYRWIKSI